MAFRQRSEYAVLLRQGIPICDRFGIDFSQVNAEARFAFLHDDDDRDETGEFDGSMTSSSFSFSTASLMSFLFRGDVR